MRHNATSADDKFGIDTANTAPGGLASGNGECGGGLSPRHIGMCKELIAE